MMLRNVIRLDLGVLRWPSGIARFAATFGVSPEEFTAQVALRMDLEELMADLTPQQREVLSLRFGLRDGQAMTLAKIGDRLNISRERVRQIEREALTKLRKRKADMREYLAS